jgi:MATE family multidrug resistance protein
MAFAGITFGFGRNYFPVFFSQNLDVIALSAQLLVVAVLFQISDGLQVVGLGLLRGLADVKIPTYITFVSYWLVSLPLAYVWGLLLNGGVVAIWLSLAIGLTIAASLLMWRFRLLSKRWQLQ